MQPSAYFRLVEMGSLKLRRITPNERVGLIRSA